VSTYVFNEPLTEQQVAEIVDYSTRRFGVAAMLRQLSDEETEWLMRFAEVLANHRAQEADYEP
jgi:hypothetical protein